MNYLYVSYWKRGRDQKFRLAGVLAVGGGKFAAHFPAEPDEQADWNEAAQEINALPGFFAATPPRVWLSQLAQRGNGLTEDYGEVGQLEAASMPEALGLAFREAEQSIPSPAPSRGKTAAAFHDLGNPLAEILPDSLLRPGRIVETVQNTVRRPGAEGEGRVRPASLKRLIRDG